MQHFGGSDVLRGAADQFRPLSVFSARKHTAVNEVVFAKGYSSKTLAARTATVESMSRSVRFVVPDWEETSLQALAPWNRRN